MDRKEMMISELFKNMPAAQIFCAADLEVTGITHDSRAVRPGMLFFALNGATTDGSRFIPQAISAGAAAVVCSSACAEDVPHIQVDNAYYTLAEVANRFYGKPSEKMRVIGVTGTNGKTSVCSFLEAILTTAGKSVGVIGTIGYRYAGHEYPAPFTTPPADRWHAMLAEMAEAGVEYVIAEISSHALVQHRVGGTRVEVGLFTNLTQDHLDFHGDMESYFAAKSRLFIDYLIEGGVALVNLDDEYGRRLIEIIDDVGGLKRASYGFDEKADVSITSYSLSTSGTELRLRTPDGPIEVETSLVGRFNVSNMAAAAAVAWGGFGLNPQQIAEGLAAVEVVSGRLEKVGDGNPACFVDYAHTPDAVENVLSTLAELKGEGRLIVVLGAGGDRDRTKRPLMGDAAACNADLVIVTSDNPRTEEPAEIIRAVTEGVSRSGKELINVEGTVQDGYLVEPQRRKAIRLALRIARPEDIVVVVGKGHEDYQILGRRKIHFSDKEELQQALKLREQNWKRFNLQDVVQATSAELTHGPSSGRFRDISTDTRTLMPGDLYLALKGERFDGADFLPGAIKAGATGVIVGRGTAKKFEFDEQISIIEVDDTLKALGDLAGYRRNRFDIPVVVIAGSCGKTTVKDMLSRMISSRERTLATKGNLNNLIGAPLTLLRLEEGHGAAVIEIGMNQPGEIARLTEISRPTIGVLLNVCPAHIEFCGGIEGVTRAKGELIDNMSPDSLLVYNADDERVVALAAKFKGEKLSFGRSQSATVRLLNSHLEEGTNVIDWTIAGESYRTEMPLAGQHNAQNFLAAAAIANRLEVTTEQIGQAVEDYSGTQMRGQIVKLAGGAELIDDTYNANPASMEAALRTLTEQAGGGRTIAVLGTMLELGDEAAKLHRQVGALIAQLGISKLVVIGDFAQDYRAGALSAGMKETKIVIASDQDAAAKLIGGEAGQGDKVLVKASRGSRLDLVVEALKVEAGE
jgi:MurE/MurF fusion protein